MAAETFVNPGDVRIVFNAPVVAEPLAVAFDFDPVSSVNPTLMFLVLS